MYVGTLLRETGMKEEKWYHILGKFLGQYRRSVLLFLVYCLIFAVLFSLYDLELEAVLYAAGLCGLLTAVLALWRFRCYLAGHRTRRRILENVEFLLDELPSPETLGEADYQEMLRKLKTIFDENVIDWQNERRESMDYYTTWVHQIKTPISVMRMNLQGVF